MNDEALKRLLFHEPEGSVVFLDIETYSGPPDLLQKEIEWVFRNERQEVEGLKAEDSAKYQKALEKLQGKIKEFQEKAALKDSAQILSEAIVCQNERHSCHFMPLSAAEEGELQSLKIFSHRAEDEPEMLKQVMALLDAYEPIKHLVTFAGSQPRGGFDLPKLRGRAAFYGLEKAQCLRRGTQTIAVDLMYEWCKYHSTAGSDYAKLGRVCDMCGLDSSKIGDGAEVASLYEAGEYVTLLSYNMVDAVILQSLYPRLI